MTAGPEPGPSKAHSSTRSWVTRGAIGIILATFFSDVGHEMVTAIMPVYLSSIGLGATALGAMEGVADLLFSLSKLAGGWVGHRARRKLPWAAAGYGLTSVFTMAMAFARSVGSLMTLRGVAWFGRGFRSPLRDFLLADEVGPTHFGRAYGLERGADMLGAVGGPLLALLLVGLRVDYRTIVVASIIPSLLSVTSFVSLVRDRPPTGDATTRTRSARLPTRFWLFLGGVFLFGLGDFSRTFLILLAIRTLGGHAASGVLVAVLLYAVHNAVSAVAAVGAGRAGDRYRKLGVLAVGYGMGVLTNVLLGGGSTNLYVLTLAILLSAVYIAIEETIEKATAAEMLPRDARSWGLGVLASANALGDMASSLWVGALLDAGKPGLAFGAAAVVGAAGFVWLTVLASRRWARSPAGT